MKTPHPTRRRFLLALASLCLGACLCAQQARDDDRPVEDASKQALQTKSNDKLPTLWLIGDSTMKVGTKGERGWGEEIGASFDPAKVNVVNRAIGGRSSRTFLTDGRWDKILEEIKPGDFVIMQFGHNDGGAINDDSRARASIKGTGEETQEIDNMLTKKHEVVHTYGWYMRKYVRDSLAHGATPVVCSLVPRKIWKDGRVERAKSSYADWAREVAVQEGAYFVDLHEIVALGYEALGQEKVEAYFADAHTHTTPEGAKFSAHCVVSGLAALPRSPFVALFSAEGAAVKPAPEDTVIASKAAK